MKANALTELRSQKLLVKPKASEPVPPPPAATIVPSPKSESGGTHRTTATMSLYPADIDRLKEIRRKLEDNGIKRVSDSEAVRVALRHVELSADELVAAYRAMQADDRRRKQERGIVPV